jgi:hypothetical protein
MGVHRLKTEQHTIKTLTKPDTTTMQRIIASYYGETWGRAVWEDINDHTLRNIYRNYQTAMHKMVVEIECEQ